MSLGAAEQARHSATRSEAQSRRRWPRMTYRRQLLLLVAPYLIGLTLLEALPALVGLPLAFTHYNALEAPVWAGLKNFRDLWNDPIFHKAIYNSLFFIVLATPSRLLGALLFALLLTPRFRGVGLYRAIVYLPTVVPDIAWALVWLWILNPIYGPLNQLLAVFGIAGPAWMIDENPARLAIVLMMCWQIGEGFVVCLAGLQDIPKEVLDQSAVDGAGPVQTLGRVVLPLLAPVLLILLFRDTIHGLQANFVPALIVGRGGGPNYATTYIPVWIYQQGFGYLRFGYAGAMTWSLYILTALIVYGQYRVAKHWRYGFSDVE